MFLVTNTWSFLCSGGDSYYKHLNETPIITHGVVAQVFLNKEQDGKHRPDDSISLFRYFLTKILALTQKEEQYEKLGVILHVITLQCLLSERSTQTHASVYLLSFRQKHQHAPAVCMSSVKEREAQQHRGVEREQDRSSHRRKRRCWCWCCWELICAANDAAAFQPPRKNPRPFTSSRATSWHQPWRDHSRKTERKDQPWRGDWR